MFGGHTSKKGKSPAKKDDRGVDCASETGYEVSGNNSFHRASGSRPVFGESSQNLKKRKVPWEEGH